MNADFINQRVKKTGITADQAASVGGIFDNINLADLGNKDGIIAQIGKKRLEENCR